MAKDFTLVSDFCLFEVRFNIKHPTSLETDYTAVIYVVGRTKAPELEIYRTAQAAAFSWGAFENPDRAGSVDHHFSRMQFEPVSINRVCQVDGIAQADADFLASTELKREWD